MQQPNTPPAPQPPPPPMVDDKYGAADAILAMPAAKALAIVTDAAASEYAKAKACERLAVVGGKEAVPALAALLGDTHLAAYARWGLEGNPDAAAGDALRTAMGRLQGPMLVGVINSLAARKDRRALDALGKLRYDSDAIVARSADRAIAQIRGSL